MGSRRNFVKLLPAGTLGAMFLNACSKGGGKPHAGPPQESSKNDPLGTLPPNFIYSQDNQGQWEGKAGSHAPVVNIDNNRGVVRIETRHVMQKKHYIVRHTLVAPNGELLYGGTFQWNDKKAISKINLGNKLSDLSTVYAFSYCSLHDLWVSTVSL